MDALTRCFSPSSRIRVNHVSVTETAKTLEQRHLSGPTAARVLAEALAGAALLSVDLAKEDERLTLQMQVDGPVGGCLAEASASGALRGYTNEKILSAFDGEGTADITPIMGTRGRMTVLQSTSKGLVYSAQVHAAPPTIRTCVARYINESQQVPAAVSLTTSVRGGYLEHASGMVAERMPDGSTEAFVSVLERFDDGQTLAALEREASVADLASLFELPDLEVVEVRNLRFQCQCNQAKILSVLSALDIKELREIVISEESQYVTCHFCGETYIISADSMKTISQQKLMEGGEQS